MAVFCKYVKRRIRRKNEEALQACISGMLEAIFFKFGM